MTSLQFTPFASNLHPAFWTKFSDLKLNVLGLDETAVPCNAIYTNSAAKGTTSNLVLDWAAFDTTAAKPHWDEYHARGTVHNKNTLESFKTCDKMGLLEAEGKRLWAEIECGVALQEPGRLVNFTALTYADMKKYHYYYWFAFPALTLPCDVLVDKKAVDYDEASLAEEYKIWKKENGEASGFCCFVQDAKTNRVKVLSLAEGLDNENSVVCFADPSTSPDHPGWPLRNILALVAFYQPARLRKGISVVCLRQGNNGGQTHVRGSLYLTVNAPELPEAGMRSFNSCVGWEKNRQGKLLPQHVNLKASMDPASLAAASVDLNLKLMKWRLVPELDLPKIGEAKCLLLGSGTLGCNVARGLMGWGVRKITFVDNGRVSYSNPVRQSLFTFDDCVDGGRYKAEAASEMVKKVFPGMESEWVDLTVPMPGHVIGETMVEDVRKQYNKLEDLIKSHDVVYLLMDTRESRWLPTLMAAAHNKLVVNAALGFDSFLVMRHGVRDGTSWEKCDDSKLVPGNKLGCYFCNDVVAPGNSSRDRTLDQQCTVTRPGVSYQAGAMAVELMASVFQHSSGPLAPASTSNSSPDPSSEGLLGYVPHSIRGSLYSFTQFLPTTSLFTNCTACSANVIEAFNAQGFDFLLKVCGEPKYLEELTGLTELMDESKLEGIVALSDDESE